MTDGQNTLEGQNLVEGQERLEGQTDKQRMELLNKEISDKTQELRALNIDTISSAEFRVIEETISSYSDEWRRLYNENNPENREQLNQIKDNLNKLEEIKNEINQRILNQTNAALNQLSNDTIASQNQIEQNQETPEQNEPEKKGIRGWWKGLTDGQRKGIGIAGGVGAGALIFGLFRRRKKKKKENSPESAGNKPGFWERPFGKFLKGSVITAGIVGGIYGLGRWFGRRGEKKEGPTGKDSDNDKFNGYEEEIVNKPENKEKFENYESLGGKIDSVYQELYGRELQSGYEDELTMQRIAQEQSKGTKFYKGIVPYCLDNQYKTVEGILSQNSSFKLALNNGLEGMVKFVKEAGADFLKMFAESYLENLPSWAPFRNAAGSLSERMDQWKVKNENAEKEMQYFFRQGIRVQTYLFQKKNQLVKILVKNASQKFGIPEDDIWDDKDLFDKYVATDSQYQNFVNSPTYAAVAVLAKNNIFDDHIDNDLKELVANIDKDRDKILGCRNGEKDIIEIINNKKERNEQLDSNDDKKLGEACNGVLDSLDDIVEVVEESAWNIYGDLFRTGDANLREYLEKSGLDKLFMSMRQTLREQGQLLKDGKLDNNKKIALAETLNGILALKKEAELGQMTIGQDYDEYGNIVYRIPGFLAGSVKNLCKGYKKLYNHEWGEGLSYLTSSCLGTGILITSTGAILLISKTTRSAGKRLIKTGVVIATLPVTVPGAIVYKLGSQIKPVRDFGHKINPVRYRGENGAQNLLTDLCEGRLSLDRAGKIIERRCFGFLTGKGQEKAWKETFGAVEDMKGSMKNVAFDSIVKKLRSEAYLNEIKKSGLYESLISKRDASKEIRQAVKGGKSMDELKVVVGRATEVVTDFRKIFTSEVNDAIKTLEATNGPLEKNAIRRLKSLGSKLTDDEVEAFVKLTRNGFDIKYIGHLDKLFDLKGSVKGVANKQLGEHLKDLLMQGNYNEFRKLMQGKQVKNSLGRMKDAFKMDSPFMKHLDDFFRRGKGASKVGDDIIEALAKILGKIF